MALDVHIFFVCENLWWISLKEYVKISTQYVKCTIIILTKSLTKAQGILNEWNQHITNKYLIACNEWIVCVCGGGGGGGADCDGFVVHDGYKTFLISFIFLDSCFIFMFSQSDRLI